MVNNNGSAVARTPMDRMKQALNTISVQEQFKNALAENANVFVASIIDLYGSDTTLIQCNPGQVIAEALKAATLKLPINKQLGFAYIVPYKTRGQYVPQMQIGYRGYIQLAMRTGWYRSLNAGSVYEGVTVDEDILTGELKFSGKPKTEKVQGYFAYFELLNGFKKSVYMTANEVVKHAKRYSKSYNSESSAWKTNFDEMAEKTVIRKLLSHYGYLSPDMLTALSSDKDDDVDNRVSSEIYDEANQQIIDIQPDGDVTGNVSVNETEGNAGEAGTEEAKGPDF
jgi:recombination protein RecT